MRDAFNANSDHISNRVFIKTNHVISILRLLKRHIHIQSCPTSHFRSIPTTIPTLLPPSPSVLLSSPSTSSLLRRTQRTSRTSPLTCRRRTYISVPFSMISVQMQIPSRECRMLESRTWDGIERLWSRERRYLTAGGVEIVG